MRRSQRCRTSLAVAGEIFQGWRVQRCRGRLGVGTVDRFGVDGVG